MSTFERTYQTDPSREIKQEIESKSIEMSDEEWLARIRPETTIEIVNGKTVDTPRLMQDFKHEDVTYRTFSDKAEHLNAKVEKVKHEKSKGKGTKGNPKGFHSKSK